VHARPVLQARVHHRAELVHPAPERRQDPLDRVAERLLRWESDVGQLDPAAALDVDAVVPVHHHLLYRRIREKLLQRTEADRLAKDQLTEARPRGRLEDCRVLLDELADGLGQGSQRAARRRLGAAALNQPSPELACKLI
jgi:hypothetical protein